MVAGFNSPIRKIAIILTNIEGEEVTEWVKNVGVTLNQLNPLADNIPNI